MSVIQTEYGNLKFRSRLEAKWAYLFDLLGVKYQYEKEGYELPSGRYLPDFWLSDQRSWLEIKGGYPKLLEITLAHELTTETNAACLIAWGDIPDPKDYFTDSAYVALDQDACDYVYRLCECPSCGFIDFQFEGRADRLSCKQAKGCPIIDPDGEYPNYDAPRIRLAYSLARKARFEYSETPKKPTPLRFQREVFSTRQPQVVDYDNIPF